jgi:hypothetical protein
VFGSVGAFFSGLSKHFDGHWIDSCTLLFSLLFAIWRYSRRKESPRPPFFQKQTGKDFLDGAVIFPLAVLIICPISSDITKSVLDSTRLTLAVAGFVAIMAVMERDD